MRNKGEQRPGGVQKVLRRWYYLARYHISKSYGLRILFWIGATAVLTGMVYGIIIVMHDLGFSKSATKLVAMPVCVIAGFVGTYALNESFRCIVAFFKGEEPEVKLPPDDVDFSGSMNDSRIQMAQDIRNGGWICGSGQLHPFYETSCSCGRKKPETEKNSAPEDKG